MGQVRKTVRVEKWKWPRRAASGPVVSWDAQVLGEDELGTWLFCPRGTQHVRPNQQTAILPCDAIQLLPAGGWWAGLWWSDERWVSVDICTPPELHGSTWHYVDLELDLVLLPDGTVELLDQEDFDAAVGKGAISPEVAEAAVKSSARLQQAMKTRREPFQEAGWSWLATAASHLVT